MHLKIAFAALATAGAIIAVTPNVASAASIGTGAFAAHEKMDNSLVEKVHRRWRHGRFYRPYYGGGYGYGGYGYGGYPSYGYYRPYYRPYYYGAYGYPYYGYRPYYGPRYYGFGPRFGFSIGF